MLTRTVVREGAAPELVAWCIVERPDAAPAWVRCGTARLNRDGSVNVRLDALPLTGELHLRPREPRPALGPRAVPAAPPVEAVRPALDA